MRYNLHIIKFFHFKCKIQWLLVYLQSCATVTTFILEYFSSLQKETLGPLAVTPSPLLVPQSMTATSLLSVPGFASSGLFVYRELHSEWSSVTGLFALALCCVYPCCRMLVFCPFLRLRNVPLVDRPGLLICSPVVNVNGGSCEWCSVSVRCLLFPKKPSLVSLFSPPSV